MYAWIIDTDHLAEEERVTTGKVEDDARGKMGPRSAPDWMTDALADGATVDVSATIYRFRMYDDDSILYYTGRMITDELPADDDACYGPLGDFGMPNAGAVRINYFGHPEMDC